MGCDRRSASLQWRLGEGGREKRSAVCQEAFGNLLGREGVGAVTELGDLNVGTPSKAPDIAVPAAREA